MLNVQLNNNKGDTMKFGEKLKLLRKGKNVSQIQIAKDLGISRRTYISYELDGRYPRNRDLYYKIADYFGVDVNYLLSENEDYLQNQYVEEGKLESLKARALTNEICGLMMGGKISEKDKDAVMLALQKAYWDNKK
jgi:transcriptional regulator with XRE-family HTH domain